MKRDEAEQVWSMIGALYDLHPERAGELAVVWVPGLEEMDASIVMRIVNDWISGLGPEKLPPLPWFAKEVRALAAVDQAPRHWDDPLDCHVCSDTGQVVVGRGSHMWRGKQRETAEQMAPCPECERGKSLEFPLEKRGPWGTLGFWRGREWQRGEEPDTVEILP